jgi:GAF domain-containing protein
MIPRPQGRAGAMVDVSTLEAGLRHLARFSVTGDNTADLLQQAMVATSGMPGVTGAGLMLLDAEGQLRHGVASDEPGMLLERTQEELGAGPCSAAFRRDELVATTDLRADERWPALARRVAAVPVRAVLAVPTAIGGGPVGSLDVYRDRPHEWDAGEAAALRAYGQLLNRLLTIAVAQDRSDETARQLQFALDYRVVIERAVGYLMHREGLADAAAFDRLRTAARSSRRKVIDLARTVLDGEPLP